MTRLLLDEMFPPHAAALLREQHGHETVHVSEVALGATAAGMNCAWPPWRCGGTTRLRASALATAVPWSIRTRCRHKSRPAALPAEVSTSPSPM